jgi:hypothetical protein
MVYVRKVMKYEWLRQVMNGVNGVNGVNEVYALDYFC